MAGAGGAGESGGDHGSAGGETAVGSGGGSGGAGGRGTPATVGIDDFYADAGAGDATLAASARPPAGTGGCACVASGSGSADQLPGTLLLLAAGYALLGRTRRTPAARLGCGAASRRR